jgi:3-deoxy-7-phosphoheptulonate synthase
MSLAAAACGADGLLVEVHRDPAQALSDGAQSLYPDQFAALMKALDPVVRAVGRTLA